MEERIFRNFLSHSRHTCWRGGGIDVSRRDNLKDKYALITGGAGLLGFEHAFALLETGAKVIITDLNREDPEETKDKLIASLSELPFESEDQKKALVKIILMN